MPYLNEADAVLPLAQGFDDSVDAVSGNAEDHVHAPIDQGFDENVASRRSHAALHVKKRSPPPAWASSLMSNDEWRAEFPDAAFRSRHGKRRQGEPDVDCPQAVGRSPRMN